MPRGYKSRNTSTHRSYPARYGSRRRGGKPGVVVAILAVALLAGLGIGFAALSGSGGDNVPSSNTNGSAADDRFFEGVFVDDIALGGLTREEAAKKIIAKQKTAQTTLGVTIIDPNGKKNRLQVSDLPKDTCTFDTDAVLDKAWAIGREGTDKERRAAIKALKSQPVKLTTTASVDPTSLEQHVRAIADDYGTPAKNATLDMEQFDPSKSGINKLTFVPEVTGKQVNPDKLWEAVKASFINGTFADVQMELEISQPVATVEGLKSLKLVKISPISAWSVAAKNEKLNTANQGHTFTTQITDYSKERLANITLANKAVSCILLPGEVFSMNEKTGDRTEAQGYQVSKIDRSGVVDKGLGGGVCQTSGTLYNAAIRYGGKYEADDSKMKPDRSLPGLAVITRDSHSLPSAYLRTGTDATVDIASKKDLRLRNDFDKPVIIVMYYTKNDKGEYFEHCDLYGPPLPDGATYDLVRKNVETLPADTTTPPKTVFSKYAKPGAPNFIEPRDGYKVDIYVSKKVKGETTDTLAYSDSYKPQPGVYYVYTGETAPTPTPSVTPSPSATATPSVKPTKTESHTPAPTPTPETTEPSTAAG